MCCMHLMPDIRNSGQRVQSALTKIFEQDHLVLNHQGHLSWPLAQSSWVPHCNVTPVRRALAPTRFVGYVHTFSFAPLFSPLKRSPTMRLARSVKRGQSEDCLPLGWVSSFDTGNKVCKDETARVISFHSRKCWRKLENFKWQWVETCQSFAICMSLWFSCHFSYSMT